MRIADRSFTGRLAAVALMGWMALQAGCANSDGDETTEQAEVIERGRYYTRLLYAQDIEGLRPHVAAVFGPEMGGMSGLDATALDIARELGAESATTSERVLDLSGETHQYMRVASFPNIPMPVSVEWLMRGRSLDIWRFDIRPLPPEAPSDHMDYLTQADLHLPFNGEWVTLWGGRTIDDNYHAEAADQRFAYDFVVFEDGYFFEGDGLRNEDHHCFGRPILSPADGTVVAAEREVVDNPPGAADNAEQPLGNHVIIDHGDGEFSFLCHFRQGTTAVRAGDRVTRGEFLGACGNSGASDIPHLHHHLQNTATPFDGEGLPAQFRDYRASGVRVERGEPTRGQFVATRK